MLEIHMYITTLCITGDVVKFVPTNNSISAQFLVIDIQFFVMQIFFAF